MAKFQLTISSAYVKSWGAWEAIRELVQNAVDAHDEGYEMRISHHTDTLRIENFGVKLDPKVWLMGTTSKDGREDQRGQFGEGLKLAILAAVRAGIDVKIINDDESWTPSLEESEVFSGARVLTVTTRQRQNSTGKFTIELKGISKEVWEELRTRFLFITKPKKVEQTYRTDVLLDEAQKGRVYVKGILVQVDGRLSAGYNFKTGVQVDRDRRMVDSFDARYAMGKAWAEISTRTPKLMLQTTNMILGNAPDVEVFPHYVSDEAATAFATDFAAKYGDGAVAVTSVAESREVEHFGLTGVVVPQSMVSILKKGGISDVATIKQEFAHATKATFSWSDLTDAEKATWQQVMEVLEPAAAKLGFEPVEARTTIVEFHNEDLNGLYSNSDGSIQVARKVLSDRRNLIHTLAHEVSHGAGGDGEKGHEEAEGKLLAEVIDNLLSVIL